MVEHQLKARGIKDERVLAAMETVQRHLFVDERLRDRAYDDCAHSIGEGQTISQPYMVAVMTELLELKGDEKVLEIGTGSGYQGAVLSILASEVFTVERLRPLALKVQVLYRELGYSNIHVITGDGTLGLPGQAPFDGIIVTAAAPRVPDVLTDQLKTGGRLVIPVGSRYSQVLYQVKKTASGISTALSTGCVFVPLIGKNGWQDNS
ncbi:protein-L-isoaspartate O-methyltransferase [bacterium BMS3Abin10]|nr:protein-L-isoaspartate O-methyltransferase [bacterium BMS3Abin10]GBE38786.1 protein-L-isoaspartate O-methyltransferase [bacterium BMS3Bbin08]